MKPYYPVVLPDIPASNYVGYPLRGVSAFGALTECGNQWEAYDDEKIRVTKLANELGPVAAACHAEHSQFDRDATIFQRAVKKKADCETAFSQFQQSTAIYEKALEAKQYCDGLAKQYKSAKAKYDKALADYNKLVKNIDIQNAFALNAYEKKLSDVKKKNGQMHSVYRGKQISHSHALRAWNDRNAKYQSYKASVAAMQRGYSYGFYMKYNHSKAPKSYKDFYAKYDWRYRTLHCGGPMMCMTQKRKIDTTNQCVVVKGIDGLGSLGATKPAAPFCTTRSVYPTCGGTCPKWYPGPGTKPVAPVEPKYLTLPKKPKPKPKPTLGSFLNGKGISGEPKLPPCKSPMIPQKPVKPICNPTQTLPAEPVKPTCVPPEIPTMPVEPDCKRPALGIGTTGLILAGLAAGGLLYATRKKKKG